MTYGNLAEEIQIEALKNIIERFIFLSMKTITLLHRYQDIILWSKWNNFLVVVFYVLKSTL
jgi:hypothetical protein